MKNLEKAKMIISYVFIGYAIIGMIVAISFQFDWDLFDRDGRVFDWQEGGASNLPFFYGLMAIAGAILLSTVKNDEKVSNK